MFATIIMKMRRATARNRYLSKIKKLALSAFDGENVKIILFGSRARGDNRLASDVDIGVIPCGKFSCTKLTLLREQFDNLNVPYKIEIVNFSDVSEDFKKEALKGAVIWKDLN